MVILGCDHAGYDLKEKIKNYLVKKNMNIVDVGASSVDNNDDFSKYVLLLRKAFNMSPNCQIIAVCGSGVGMNIGLNKTKGIRCVLGNSVKQVRLARQHNDINAISFGGRNASFFKAKKMINAFFNTDFLGGKYKKRMDEIDL